MSTLTFVNNLAALVPTGGVSYDASVALNLKNFGVDVGGNWNEPDINYGATGTVSANLTGFLTGTASGISCTIADAADAGDTSGDGTSFTATFPAGIYQRGARIGYGASVTGNPKLFRLTFAGFTNNTPVKVVIGFYVTPSAYVTSKLGTVAVNGGATTAVNCASPIEYEIETTADGSGNVQVDVVPNEATNNGVGLCGVKIDYVS